MLSHRVRRFPPLRRCQVRPSHHTSVGGGYSKFRGCSNLLAVSPSPPVAIACGHTGGDMPRTISVALATREKQGAVGPSLAAYWHQHLPHKVVAQRLFKLHCSSRKRPINCAVLAHGQ